jgi:molybdopterin synthase sulfur carrier subunit
MSNYLTILYFASLREKIGMAEEKVCFCHGTETVAKLMDHLSTLDGVHASVFQDRRLIRCAVNQEFADILSPIRPGDEVAFFPPVTGG